MTIFHLHQLLLSAIICDGVTSDLPQNPSTLSGGSMCCVWQPWTTWKSAKRWLEMCGVRWQDIQKGTTSHLPCKLHVTVVAQPVVEQYWALCFVLRNNRAPTQAGRQAGRQAGWCACVHACVGVSVYVCMHVCACVRACVCAHARGRCVVCVCGGVWGGVCVRARVCACVRACVCGGGPVM